MRILIRSRRGHPVRMVFLERAMICVRWARFPCHDGVGLPTPNPCDLLTDAQQPTPSGARIDESFSFDGFGRRAVGRFNHHTKTESVPVDQEIFAQALIRDVQGRVRSASWRFTHTVYKAPGVPDTEFTPPSPWRGYDYNPRGQLAQVWEHPGTSSVVDTSAIPPHFAGSAEVDSAGAANAALDLTFQRTTAIGDLQSISPPPAPHRPAGRPPRAPPATGSPRSPWTAVSRRQRCLRARKSDGLGPRSRSRRPEPSKGC